MIVMIVFTDIAFIHIKPPTVDTDTAVTVATTDQVFESFSLGWSSYRVQH